MTYPSIFVPHDIPGFITDDHAIDPASHFAFVQRGSGHSRSRPKCTSAPRVVTVTGLLTRDQMASLDAWFEGTLRVGERHFTVALMRNQEAGSLLYWDAVWVAKYVATPFASRLGLMWRYRGQLLLTGEGTATKPESDELAVEYGFALEGTALILGNDALDVEYGFALESEESLSVEYGFALLPPELELRDGDGGYELREDGSYELRD